MSVTLFSKSDSYEIVPGCKSTTKACPLLMGLIYALNCAYPPILCYTFKVLSELLLEMDQFKLYTKENTLK